MGGRYKYVFWAALIIAAIATFGAYRYLQANSTPPPALTKQVVVAKVDIPEGAAIDRVSLAIAGWPAATVPAGAYSSLDSVVGRVTRVNVFTGEAIVPGRLAPAGTGPVLELTIPPGMRAMAIRVSDVSSMSGLIQPNSRVDVMVTIADPTTGKQQSKLFMENMRVLSVGTEIQRDAQGKPNAAPIATLAVTPEQAEVLAIAMNTGSIQLVLRGYGDPSGISTSGANSADVLAQLRSGRISQPAEPSAPRPVQRAAPRPSAPPAPIIQRPPPPPPPDSAVVNVFRSGKATPQKFDTTIKR